MSYAAVARFTSPQEAHIAAGALAAEGFNAKVFDENISQYTWGLGQAIGYRLMVPDVELPEARTTLKALEAGANVIQTEPADQIPQTRWRKLSFALLILLTGA